MRQVLLERLDVVKQARNARSFKLRDSKVKIKDTDVR